MIESKLLNNEKNEECHFLKEVESIYMKIGEHVIFKIESPSKSLYKLKFEEMKEKLFNFLLKKFEEEMKKEVEILELFKKETEKLKKLKEFYNFNQILKKSKQNKYFFKCEIFDLSFQEVRAKFKEIEYSFNQSFEETLSKKSKQKIDLIFEELKNTSLLSQKVNLFSKIETITKLQNSEDLRNFYKQEYQKFFNENITNYSNFLIEFCDDFTYQVTENQENEIVFFIERDIVENWNNFPLNLEENKNFLKQISNRFDSLKEKNKILSLLKKEFERMKNFLDLNPFNEIEFLTNFDFYLKFLEKVFNFFSQEENDTIFFLKKKIDVFLGVHNKKNNQSSNSFSEINFQSSEISFSDKSIDLNNPKNENKNEIDIESNESSSNSNIRFIEIDQHDSEEDEDESEEDESDLDD